MEPSDLLWENLVDIINLCIIFAQNCIAVLCKSLFYSLTDTLLLFLLLLVDDIIRFDNMEDTHVILYYIVSNTLPCRGPCFLNLSCAFRVRHAPCIC